MSLLKPSAIFKDGANWSSGDVRAYMKDQVGIFVDSITDVRDNDLEQTRFVFVMETGALYRLNPSSGAEDDGSTNLRDNGGRVYQRIADLASTGVATVAAVHETTLPSGVDYILTAGYASAGDGGGAAYKRASAEPSHPGKVQSADGAWWELAEPVPNVHMFGAKGDGTTDDLQAIHNAIAYKNAKGGGIVRFLSGVYRVTGPILVGDGSDTQVSTKDHRITLVGQGIGSHNGADFVQQTGATEILYDGASSATAAVISFEGPIHASAAHDLVANANNKAGYGVRLMHVANAQFSNVAAKRPTIAGWVLTTRTGFPSGCAYGCGNNVLLNCYTWEPAANADGIALDSGVSSALSLTGQPDAANNDIIGGVYFYGEGPTGVGAYLGGADNNTFYGTQFIPSGEGGGYSVFFNPWVGDTRFPLENIFINIGSKEPVGGVSGTYGNTFLIFQEGDGAPAPQMANVNVQTHAGVEYIGGKRSRKVRDVASATLDGSTQSTNSTSFVICTPLQATITNAKAGSKLRVRASIRCGKVTAGSADFAIGVNTSVKSNTTVTIPFNTAFQNAAMEYIQDVAADGNFAVGVYFKSSDSNNASITHGTLIVEELF